MEEELCNVRLKLNEFSGLDPLAYFSMKGDNVGFKVATLCLFLVKDNLNLWCIYSSFAPE